MLNNYKTILTTAAAKALATKGTQGVNVVPVSALEVQCDNIVLFDFFMNKTVQNIKSDPDVALTCWQGLGGIQVKGRAEYHSEGELYSKASDDMKQRFPERILHGIILIKPVCIYDISPGEGAGRMIAG